MLFHCFFHKREPITNRNALLEKRIRDLGVLIALNACVRDTWLVSTDAKTRTSLGTSLVFENIG